VSKATGRGKKLATRRYRPGRFNGLAKCRWGWLEGGRHAHTSWWGKRSLFLPLLLGTCLLRVLFLFGRWVLDLPRRTGFVLGGANPERRPLRVKKPNGAPRRCAARACRAIQTRSLEMWCAPHHLPEDTRVRLSSTFSRRRSRPARRPRQAARHDGHRTMRRRLFLCSAATIHLAQRELELGRAAVVSTGPVFHKKLRGPTRVMVVALSKPGASCARATPARFGNGRSRPGKRRRRDLLPRCSAACFHPDGAAPRLGGLSWQGPLPWRSRRQLLRS
jgi:hypothetical protein